MFEVGIVAHFEAAHQLRGDFGPAERLHGHTYRLEVAARGRELRDDGTLLDLAVVQDAVKHLVDSLNYTDLDAHPWFQGRNSTVEVVACELGQRLAPALRARGLAELSVRVWESPTAFGGYSCGLA